MIGECNTCIYYDAELDECLVYICDGNDCPELPCEK